ncbi:hypothetical protein DAPPUDRAFT_233723 [Daphnia pulex]|uniref:Uncharacterized protein n=1 Tax=Daphnia pulex TaxID=6669 RepID=E9FVJ7_DAPPU|nr:hypothetical protein DAPPUDRAFT_233723 [Daphnia pulex]|eukprot:EFX88566.1 hypothetical protein DAPPUDRAFT_233723 [Daphnia pulex]
MGQPELQQVLATSSVEFCSLASNDRICSFGGEDSFLRSRAFLSDEGSEQNQSIQQQCIEFTKFWSIGRRLLLLVDLTAINDVYASCAPLPSTG